jgi:hypothetical protein
LLKAKLEKPSMFQFKYLINNVFSLSDNKDYSIFILLLASNRSSEPRHRLPPKVPVAKDPLASVEFHPEVTGGACVIAQRKVDASGVCRAFGAAKLLAHQRVIGAPDRNRRSIDQLQRQAAVAVA